MKTLNLVTYKHDGGSGNFGDELSHVIMKYLFEKYSINNAEIVINNEKNINIVFIGSLIEYAVRTYNNIFIFGSGIRKEDDKIIQHKNIKIYSVRGPLSQQYMEKNNYTVPPIYGDPALLLPLFYRPNKLKDCENKIGVIGHITNFKKYRRLPREYVFINPVWHWKDVIDHIFSCKLVLSSSLHGLIVSDAYNVPNIWLDQYALQEGHFKFQDYFSSQGRKYESIQSIDEHKKVTPYTEGNKVDLNKLESAFIRMCTDLNIK